jgi:hypothetical protein
MKLLPLLDLAGNVKFWTEPRTSWIADLDAMPWQEPRNRKQRKPLT